MRQRPGAGKRGDGRHPIAQPGDPRAFDGCRNAAQVGEVLPLLLVMDQRDNMHLVAGRQESEQVVGPNPIAAIRRIRQPMSQKQDPH
jgi:hypothetical protein